MDVETLLRANASNPTTKTDTAHPHPKEPTHIGTSACVTATPVTPGVKWLPVPDMHSTAPRGVASLPFCDLVSRACVASSIGTTQRFVEANQVGQCAGFGKISKRSGQYADSNSAQADGAINDPEQERLAGPSVQLASTDGLAAVARGGLGCSSEVDGCYQLGWGVGDQFVVRTRADTVVDRRKSDAKRNVHGRCEDLSIAEPGLVEPIHVLLRCGVRICDKLPCPVRYRGLTWCHLF